MSTKLGRPLAVVSTTAICDGPGRHEARLITDGITAFGYLLGTGETDLGTASVGGVLGAPPVVEWSCTGDDTDCTGYLSVILSDDAWTGDPEAVSALVEYGTEVER